ncbi:EAL domain-containing protein [Brevibacillus reuszeri]|uniref:EAL domain-containing protein n=1 Tax=Brevibacillus reuszeri TaxID=54915 RepID=UPI002899EB5D|nr:EAL domain-containing protein [Brevibacillus reuszeri]
MSNDLLLGSHYPVFQPLVHLGSGEIFGYEALLRSKTASSPDALFRNARLENRLYELDTYSMRTAISSYFNKMNRLGNSPFLFLNVFPSTLLNPGFLDFLHGHVQKYRSIHQQIVLEINEANEEDKMWDIRLLGQKIRELRQHGFLIALDDVGSGAASLKKIVEYEPDIVKLDRYFGNQLSVSSAKQRLVSLFVDFCLGQIQLVLEGMEEPEDLAIAQALGVPIGQGFFLGRPNPLPLNDV